MINPPIPHPIAAREPKNYRFSTASACKKGQRKKRLYRKNDRYNRCMWCLFICTEIYKFFYTFRINLIINLRKWKQYFSVKVKKYSFQQDLSVAFYSIIIFILLYLFKLFLFFLALCSPFQFAPVRSELQAEFFITPKPCLFWF